MLNRRPLEIKNIKPGQLIEFVSDYNFYNDNKNWSGQNKFYSRIGTTNPETYIEIKKGSKGMVLDILHKTTYDYVASCELSNLNKDAPKIIHLAILFLYKTTTYIISLHSYNQTIYEQMPDDIKDNYFRCYAARKIL